MKNTTKNNETKNNTSNNANINVCETVTLRNGSIATTERKNIAFVRMDKAYSCVRFAFLEQPTKDEMQALHLWANSYRNDKVIDGARSCFWAVKPTYRKEWTVKDVAERLEFAGFVLVKEDCFFELLEQSITNNENKALEAWEMFATKRKAESAEDAMNIEQNEASKALEAINKEMEALEAKRKALEAEAKAKAKAKATKASAEAKAPKVDTDKPKALPKTEAKASAEALNNEAIKTLIASMIAEALKSATSAEAPKTNKGKGKGKASK